MSKRFTATQKWDDPWFDNLSDGDRLFWIFLLDKCDHAGIWDVNWRLAEYHLRHKPDPAALGDRVVQLGNGKLFIPKFLEFQYGELNEDNRVHASVMAILRKEGLLDHHTIKGLISPIQGRKDKDTDKDMDKDKARESFATFWSAYPKKKAKPVALKAWLKLLPDQATVARILAAVTIQSASPDWRKDDGQFIPYPATWINQRRWEDHTATPTAVVSARSYQQKFCAWDDGGIGCQAHAVQGSRFCSGHQRTAMGGNGFVQAGDIL